MKQQLSRLGWITFTALLIAGPMFAQINPARESLLIGAGDQIHISVFREPDLDTKARVTDAGDITLPLVGSLHVAGLNPAQAANAIAKLYEADHFLKSAQVSLLIDEYATQTVSIVGEVQKPGSYPISTPRSVMDAIAAAGGLTPSADRHITIEHRGDVVEKQEVFLPNNANDTLAAQVKVYPGDLIVVPKEGIVYVLGDVGKPGGYTMDDDSKITVLQAVAMASGANHTAVEGHVRLVRRTPQGASTEITISLSAMQKGKIPDMQLQANDVLWVPFSYGKNFAVNGSTILGVAGSAAVYHY